MLINGKEYNIRKRNLNDISWMQKTFGQKLEALFADDSVNYEAVCKVVFNQIEDKSDFVAEEVTEIDVDGNTTTAKVGGYKKMMQLMTEESDQILVLQVFNGIMGVAPLGK